MVEAVAAPSGVTFAEMTVLLSKRYTAHNVNSKAQAELLGMPSVFVKKFLKLCQEAAGEADADAVQDLATELLAVELGVFQASVTRMRLQVLVADKDRAFYEERQKAINSEVQGVLADIEAKREELDRSKVFQGNQQQYEKLRCLVIQLPCRQHTQQKIAAIRLEIERAKLESSRLDEQLQRRRKQFAFLAHALRDLQCSLQDEAALAPVSVAKHDQMDTTED